MYNLLKELGVSVILNNGELGVTTKINLQNENKPLALRGDLFRYDNKHREVYSRTHHEFDSYITETEYFGDDVSTAITSLESSGKKVIKRDRYELSNLINVDIECYIEEYMQIKTEIDKNKIKTVKWWNVDNNGDFYVDSTLIVNKETGRIVKSKKYKNGLPELVTTTMAGNDNEIKSISITTYDTEHPQYYVDDKWNVTFKYSYYHNRLKCIRKYVNGEHVVTIRFFYNNGGLVNIKYFTEERSFPEKTLEFKRFCDSISEVTYIYDDIRNDFVVDTQRELPLDKYINLVLENSIEE